MLTGAGGSTRDLDADYPLDPAERAAYRERGWARVEGVIPRELALSVGELVPDTRHAGPTSAALGSLKQGAGRDDEVRRQYDLFSNVDRGSDDVRRIALSRRLGSLATGLLGAARVQHFRSSVFAKLPQHDGGLDTSLHQDFPFTPFDRSRSLTVWIALADLPATAGTLRFIDGSHTFGVLGRDAIYRRDHDLVQSLGRTREWTLSEPLALRAGDATVHADLTVHGADANTSDIRRLGLAIYYLAADTLYTGAWSEHVPADTEGLAVNQPFPETLFPLVGS